MADYQLTATEEPCVVLRNSDGAYIPPDMANRDYNGDQFSPGYIQWVEGGGEPDPYVPPPVAPLEPTVEQEIAFDHENRLRVLEGQPPLEFNEFVEDRLK